MKTRKIIFLVLSCLTCKGLGRRVQTSNVALQSRPSVDSEQRRTSSSASSDGQGHVDDAEAHQASVEKNTNGMFTRFEVFTRFLLSWDPAALFTSSVSSGLGRSCPTTLSKRSRLVPQVAVGGPGANSKRNPNFEPVHSVASRSKIHLAPRYSEASMSGSAGGVTDEELKEKEGDEVKEEADDSKGKEQAAVATFATAVAAAAASLAGRLRLVTRHQLSVAAVLIAAFLNLLGFTMAGPITPALGAHFGLEVGASLGWLTSAYPMGMLVGLLLWPPLSDRVGRKPVMALSLLGSGVGLAVQGLAVRQCWSFSAFLALRAITGSMAGASPVAKAYLADVGSGTGQLPRYMSWRDAASTLAFIVGPLLSGQLYLGKQAVGLGQDRSLAAVIATSGVYSLLASAFVAIFVSETPAAPKKKAEQSGATASAKAEAPEADQAMVACPLGATQLTAVATVCIISALYNFGTAPFDAFFPSLVKSLAGLDELGIGKAKASLATLSLIISATTAARVQRRFGAVTTCVLGLSASAIGLIGFSAVVAYGGAVSSSLQITLFWAAAAMYQVGVPLFAPTIPTMLLQCVPRKRRGAVMGLDSSINAVARIVSAPLLGALYGAAGPAFCFGTAGGVLFLSAATTIIRRVFVMRGLY